MMIRTLIVFFLLSVIEAGVISDIMTDYERGISPAYPDVTQITSFIYVENTLSIDETNTMFSVTLNLISFWEDARLAYPDSVSPKTSIDMSTQVNNTWKPQIQITDNVKDSDLLSESMTLYKNGTLKYNRRLNLDLKCGFDYRKMPKDKHHCRYVFYPLNYDKSMVQLNVGNIENTTESIVLQESELPIKIIGASLKEREVHLYSSDRRFSGIVLDLTMERKWNFILYTVVVPSLLVTLISYLGFWIDKNGVPGRAYLGSLAILINVNSYLLPRVSSITWIGQFLLGCMTFGVFTMIEYCILNYCMFCYNTLNTKIEELIAQINSDDLEQEHEIQVLNELRKSGVAGVGDQSLEEKIDEVQKEVLNGKPKEVSFAGDNKEDEKAENPPEIEQRKRPLAIDTKKNNKDDENPKHSKSAQLKLQGMKLKTEKRKKTDDDIPEEFRDAEDPNFILQIEEDEDQDSVSKSESLMPPNVNKSESKMVQIQESEDTEEPNFKKLQSVAVRKHKANLLNLEKETDKSKSSSDSSGSPVKQEFLPVSTRHVEINCDDNPSEELKEAVHPNDHHIESKTPGKQGDAKLEKRKDKEMEGKMTLQPQNLSKKDMEKHLKREAKKEKQKNMEGKMTFQPRNSSKTVALLRKLTKKAKHNLHQKIIQSKSRFAENSVNPRFPNKSFQRLKSKLIEDKDEIEKLKPETREKIEKVVQIESSIKYRLSRHIMNRLDIFSRFWFPIVYFIWLNTTLFMLDYNVPRFVILWIMILSAVAGYVIMKIKQVKDEKGYSTWQAVKYYKNGKCCRLDKHVKLK